MSPRKERYQTPEHIAQGIRNQRKKLLFGPFSCPQCGKEKLVIDINKNASEVKISCPCGIEENIKFVPVYEATDYYCKFVDAQKKK